MNASILVAGGGIGGLAAALSLSRAGFDVTVMEKASRFGEIGAGIQLGPNAFRAFDYLGLGDQARAMAVRIDRLRLLDSMTGEPFWRLELDAAFERRFANPYAVVHRGDLHAMLLAACRERASIALRTRAEVVGYDQDGAGVVARLADGEEVRGSALIGADGLRSRVREQLLGDGAPRVSGHTTYRSVIPVERMPEALRWNEMAIWCGPKCHLVHYPVSNWTQFNIVATYHNDAPEPVAGVPVTDEEAMAGFLHVTEAPQSVVRAGMNWKKWVLCDREPVDGWVEGRAALLGDAAHPTLQYWAQGACMAIEDGVVLGDALARTGGEVEPALLAYRDRRVLRTTRIQLESRAIGDHIYHPAGPHAALRNALMRQRSQAQWWDTLAWLYDGVGTDTLA